jgi:hypothetical protein
MDLLERALAQLAHPELTTTIDIDRSNLSGTSGRIARIASIEKRPST